MNSKKGIIIGVVIIILAVAVIAIYGTEQKEETTTELRPEIQPTFETLLEGDAEKEETASAEAPSILEEEESEVKLYEILALSDGFNPQETIVSKDEASQISVIAEDGDYDIVFPDPLDKHFILKTGQSAVFRIKSDTPAGRYVFACKDQCPEGGPISGTLIIK